MYEEISYELNHEKKRIEVTGNSEVYGKIIKSFEGSRKNGKKPNTWFIPINKLPSFEIFFETLKKKDVQQNPKESKPPSDDEGNNDYEEEIMEESKNVDEIDENTDFQSDLPSVITTTSRLESTTSRQERTSSRPSRMSNSPSSRKHLFHKDSPEYTTKYSEDKINYYKSIGKKHIEPIEDDSTDEESSESSDDDYPKPPPKRNTKKENIKDLEKQIRDIQVQKRKH